MDSVLAEPAGAALATAAAECEVGGATTPFDAFAEADAEFAAAAVVAVFGEVAPLAGAESLARLSFAALSLGPLLSEVAEPAPPGWVAELAGLEWLAALDDGGALEPLDDGGALEPLEPLEPLDDGGALEPLDDGGALEPLDDGGALEPLDDGGALEPLEPLEPAGRAGGVTWALGSMASARITVNVSASDLQESEATCRRPPSSSSTSVYCFVRTMVAFAKSGVEGARRTIWRTRSTTLS